MPNFGNLQLAVILDCTPAREVNYNGRLRNGNYGGWFIG
jgi:hypothetical protein